MENKRSNSQGKKNMKDNIRKKTPNFLISDQKPINYVTIAKHDDEIIINCDNANYKTIPDSVFKYLCSTNADKLPNNKVTGTATSSNSNKKTRARTSSNSNKKTRRKK